MSWNYRVMAQMDGEDVYLSIHEVYYDENNIPNSYTANPITIGGGSIDSLAWSIDKIKIALEKPILWYGEKFPNEYKQ